MAYRWGRCSSSRGGVAVAGADVVFFGHTPMPAPIASANTRWIDTGAFMGKRLTLAELAAERGPAWQRFRRDSRPLPAGVNLCWSLAGPMDQTAMARAMDAIEELFS